MNAFQKMDTGFSIRLCVCAVLLIGFSLFVPGFLSVENMASLSANVGLIGLVGAGIMLTMIIGQLDLAVASVATVAAIIAIEISNVSLGLGILAALAAAGIYGAVMGYTIHRTKVSSLVLTVCALISLKGLALVILPKRPALLPDDLYMVSDTLVSAWGPLTLMGAIALALLAIVAVFLRKTRLGLALYAVGGSFSRARGSGVETLPVYICCFAGSAILGACAGILAALRSGSASSVGFDSFLLAGVTVAIVGGVPLEGGKGRIVNVIVGAIIVRLIASAVSLTGMPSSVESIGTGGILLVMLIFDYFARSQRNT